MKINLFLGLAKKEVTSVSVCHYGFYTCLQLGFIHRLHRYDLHKTARENMEF